MMEASGHGEEVDALWIHGAEGPSPVFPCLSFFFVNNEYQGYNVWDAFSGCKPEPVDLNRGVVDSSERLLDQNGRIYMFINHKNGFYYPKQIDEPLLCSHLLDAIQLIGEMAFEEFLPLKELNTYMMKYCSDYPFEKLDADKS